MNPFNKPVSGRDLSRASYAALAPRLTGQRRKVLEALRQYGPLTANEVAGVLPRSDLSNFNVRSRLRELVDLGLVVINREVKDPVSGHLARQYRAVEPGEQPPASAEVERPRRKSRGQLLVENAQLRAENEALKLKLSSKGKLMSNTVEPEDSEPEEDAKEDDAPPPRRRREPLLDPNDDEQGEPPPAPHRRVVDEDEDAPPLRRRAVDDDPDAHRPREIEEDPEARHPHQREEDPVQAPPVEQKDKTDVAFMDRLRRQAKLMANLREAYRLLANCGPLGDHGKALAKAIEEYMD